MSIKHVIAININQLWYPKTHIHRCALILFSPLLLPLSLLWLLAQQTRYYLNRHHLIKNRVKINSTKPLTAQHIPVVVIGNITVGGTGKTPLIIHLATELQRLGYSPAIISRGYGAQTTAFPYLVSTSDSAITVGDEPSLLAATLNCPIVIDPNRKRAVEFIRQQQQCNNLQHDKLKCDLILSDDGLQHYALQRDIEIIVVDQSRGFGNHCLLPLGPLREPVSKIKHADFIVINGDGSTFIPGLCPAHIPTHTCEHQPQYIGMQMRLHHFRRISDGTIVSPTYFSTPVHAVAAIGNPQRFFDSLTHAGLNVIPHAFPDHYSFQKIPEFADDFPIIITLKDSVKFHPHLSPLYWVMETKVQIDLELLQQLQSKLTQ